MPNQQIIDYLNQNKNQFSIGVLISELEKKGWQEFEIKEALRTVFDERLNSDKNIIKNIKQIYLFLGIFYFITSCAIAPTVQLVYLNQWRDTLEFVGITILIFIISLWPTFLVLKYSRNNLLKQNIILAAELTIYFVFIALLAYLLPHLLLILELSRMSPI